MWKELASQLAHEKALLGARINSKSLKKLYEGGYAALEIKDEKIIAFAALWDTTIPKWRELGSVWVCKKHRNHKLGSKVFLACASLVQKDAFLITKNEKISHLARSAGFKKADINTWQKIPCSISCGPCDYKGDRINCPMRATQQCQLFYK